MIELLPLLFKIHSEIVFKKSSGHELTFSKMSYTFRAWLPDSKKESNYIFRFIVHFLHELEYQL